LADHGLDSGTTSELAFDGAEHAALLAGDEDAVRIGRVMTAVALVDIGALDRAAGESLGVLDGCTQRVPVVRIAGQRSRPIARRSVIAADPMQHR
jgi:hypothetical protein